MNIEDLQNESGKRTLPRAANLAADLSSAANVAFDCEEVKVVNNATEGTFQLCVSPSITDTTHEHQSPGTTKEASHSQAHSSSSISTLHLPPEMGRVAHEIGARKSQHDLKQHFNAIYFSLCAAAIGFYILLGHAPHLVPLFLALLLLAGIGLLFAFKPHTTYLRSSICFPPFTSRLLRIGVMLLPILFLIAPAAEVIARSEIAMGYQDYWASKYNSSLEHYKRAAMLAPGSADAFIGLSADNRALGNYKEAIANAENAIALDATKSYAWSDKARAQYKSDSASEDAIGNAEKALSLDSTNGEAAGLLAELYLNTGNFDKALVAANSHVKLHWDEAEALEVRANILEKLGQTAEAAADRLAMKQKKN